MQHFGICPPSNFVSECIQQLARNPAAMETSSIISQIRGAESFFASQVRIGICPEVLEQSKASMTRSLVAQIGELRTLDVEGAAVLNTTIAESGSFDTSHKTMLASAVSSKALQPTGAHGGPHKGTQSLLNPICNFTKADWDVFEDAQANLTKKVVVAARRLQHIHQRPKTLSKPPITRHGEEQTKYLQVLMVCV